MLAPTLSLTVTVDNCC